MTIIFFFIFFNEYLLLLRFSGYDLNLEILGNSLVFGILKFLSFLGYTIVCFHWLLEVLLLLGHWICSCTYDTGTDHVLWILQVYCY